MINEIRCPECDESEFTMSTEEDKFQYGIGPKSVEVIVSVPVHTCTCGFQFTDYEAEELRHEAVCQHLGEQS